MKNSNTKIPRHVALIMDGNGRWATRKHKTRSEGHSAGTKHLQSVIKAFFDSGVSHLSFYGFSSENWNRPKSEIGVIFSLLTRAIDNELTQITDMRLKFIHIGDKQRLPVKVRESLVKMEQSTQFPDPKGTISLAFNYGSHQEIIAATKRILDHSSRSITIDKDVVSEHLYTAGIPDVDLLIRTGGEKRLSNFLLWQCVNAKFVPTDTLWPDFTDNHVEYILKFYSQL